MTDLQKGLVGHWTMDDSDTSGGTLYDRSAYDRNGVLQNGVTTSVSSPLGQGYSFDGDDDFVQMPNNPYNGALDKTTVKMSLSSWIYPTGLQTDSTNHAIQNCWMAHSSGGSNDNMEMGVDASTNDIQVYFDTNGADETNTTTGVTAPLNTWTHIVVTLDLSSTPTMKLYKNGVLALTDTSTWSATSGTLDDASNTEFTLGASRSFRNPYTGRMSDARLYSRVLSANEVRALYNMRSQRQVNANSAHTEDLLLHLNARVDRSVDEANNRWYDISGNNHEAHGTDGEGSIVDSSFPNWEPTNGGRFVLNGAEGWNIPGPIETSGQVSFESWFYKDDLTNDNEYLADARNGTGDWQLTNYGNQNISFHNDLVADDPETHQPDSNWWDRWTHLVATSDGTTSQLFIDGEQITDSRLKSSNGFPTGVGQDFAIANRFTGRAYLEGYMSVYRIYDTILSPAQVSANYNAEKMFYK